MDGNQSKAAIYLFHILLSLCQITLDYSWITRMFVIIELGNKNQNVEEKKIAHTKIDR